MDVSKVRKRVVVFALEKISQEFWQSVSPSQPGLKPEAGWLSEPEAWLAWPEA